MVKSILSSIMAFLIILLGILYENTFISKQFNEFSDILDVLYEKVNDQVATENDVYAVQENWLNKKKFLHIFIPHTEIKEFDLWIAETVKLVRDKKWEDSISKVEVLKELSEQVPKTFLIKLENIL